MRKTADAKMDLPKLEEAILEYWNNNKIFEKSLEQNIDKPTYSFYDGPPFATGTPHYGHIVASIMKDAIPRYWCMQGYNVPRKWGWDCHGLPIENITEKELGLKTKKDIEEIGIEKFNEFCRSKVLEYVDEWKVVINRLGRWADMDKPYKTMDLSYMESVWWVFKELWNRGLVYESYRSMHICPRCETTLSQSEVTEGYKMVKDLSATVEFELLSQPGTYVLAWTTTPWTLIGNVALAVGADIDYVTIEKADQGSGKTVRFILAKDRLVDNFGEEGYRVVSTQKGESLARLEYKPAFNYYSNDEKTANRENGWKIYTAEFVTTDEGSGVVHIAPAFGEDDMKLGQEKNLPFIQHIGMDGVIKEQANEFAGMHVKPADDVQRTDVEIIKYLAKNNILFDKAKYEHSYPHCWRCDTPLLNYATSSLFVSVEKLKDRAMELAGDIEWSPSHIKKGRFGKWLEGARDWSISRQRFWASCIPIWKCECGESKVIGSVAELENLSGCKINDLHKHIIDKVTFKCSKCGKLMHRVPDVLDTWFDSASMPYAQQHYPFENKEKFEESFPAEYIGEGVDQTRAWFYYLHVVSTALFDKPAYKHVTVNGIALAEDGKKMSKRLKNYPDPMEMFNKYGADVMRYYLLTSPVMAAENLNFTEKEMVQISRGMFRMLWNSYYFFTMYANLDDWHGDWQEYKLSENILDRWIISELESLNLEVDRSMKKYDLVKSSRIFGEFIDNLSNWYIRRSRKRFWKSENDTDKDSAYATLNYVLVKLSLLLAPFCPFISEDIYRNLTDGESVHLQLYPKSDKERIDTDLISHMMAAREVIETALAIRDIKGIKVRQPLSQIEYTGESLGDELESIIAEEVNVKTVRNVEKLSFEPDKDNKVSLDVELTDELLSEGYTRDLIREIQVARKEFGLDVSDRIILGLSTDSSKISGAIDKFRDDICNEVLAQKLSVDEFGEMSKTAKVAGEEIIISIKKEKHA